LCYFWRTRVDYGPTNVFKFHFMSDILGELCNYTICTRSPTCFNTGTHNEHKKWSYIDRCCIIYCTCCRLLILDSFGFSLGQKHIYLRPNISQTLLIRAVIVNRSLTASNNRQLCKSVINLMSLSIFRKVVVIIILWIWAVNVNYFVYVEWADKCVDRWL
jgi:hypothetical protein